MPGVMLSRNSTTVTSEPNLRIHTYIHTYLASYKIMARFHHTNKYEQCIPNITTTTTSTTTTISTIYAKVKVSGSMPDLRHTEPISKPMTPPPTTTRCLGTASSSRAPVESTIFFATLSTLQLGRGLTSDLRIHTIIHT
jgi:hypothetical protein